MHIHICHPHPEPCSNPQNSRMKSFMGYNKFHVGFASSATSSSAAFCWLVVPGFSTFKIRPVIGSTGRMSRGPPLRPIATIGGGGNTPALKRMRWTGSDGCAPTDNQYLWKTMKIEVYLYWVVSQPISGTRLC